MLKAHVADGALSQKLLYETQKLFTYMQRSLKKFVDPTSLAASIRTYEDAQIDVSVQMDVDEFYNLLFDRWEGQILSPVDKLTFRAFYGGQLVQQVKSKECPHISERLEVFSAIQCDIKGKASLQESLQAYVDGEVMEGDNKYKCSTCDRHVNAVKRACLKDIPDNLIFHLKRFDFNLRLMTRSKINDYFSFPHRIDMRPYTVEHIMGEAGRETEDIYELVGILVHTGTAESGHYYSYIRERPSTMQPPTWLEFNDDTVLPVDATTIEASCFGGPDYRGPDGTGGYQFDKTYSAYMLFYQRASLLEQQQRDLHAISASQLTVPAPRGLSNYIAGENEMLLRKYCLYDEGHPQFVLRLLENARHINKGRCSEDHALEKDALFVTLCHFDQVVCRTKDLPDLQAYTLTLNEKIRTCVDCASNFLEWMVGNEEAFKLLLFRNPDQSVRFEVALAVFSALSKVKQEGNESQYGLSDESMDDDAESEYASPRIFLRLTEVLKRFWDHFHLNTKAWPEYFGLLVNIAQLGPQEAAILLDMKFLFRALEVISADRNLHIHPQYQRMLNIVEKRPLNKPVSYEHVIALAEVLLKACDLKAATIHEDTLRLDMLGEGAKLPLTDDEQSMLVQHWTRGHVNIFCEKLLFINQNEKSTQEIIRMMVTRGSSVESVLNAIRAGIRKTAHVGPVTPYLKAALTLIANTDSRKYIEHLVQYTSTVARQLDGADGLDFLRFFKELMDVPTHNAGISKEYFINYVIEQIPEWAPSLLTYYDSTVRAETEGYVQQALIRTALEESLDVSDGQEQSVVLQTARRLGVNCLKYLHDEHVRPRVQIVRAALYNIQAVIDQCRRLYDQQSEDELDREFYSLHQRTLNHPLPQRKPY
jgi:ubiquitin carboxyl-terminal hydrolase 34